MKLDDMEAVRIYDLNAGHLAFDLREILAAIGPQALSSVWTVGGVQTPSGLEPLMVVGDEANKLPMLAQSRVRISGISLAEIMKDVQQVIWGEFSGFETVSSFNPWIVVTAIDSTFWEVRSSDKSAPNRLKARFKDVRAA